MGTQTKKYIKQKKARIPVKMAGVKVSTFEDKKESITDEMIIGKDMSIPSVHDVIKSMKSISWDEMAEEMKNNKENFNKELAEFERLDLKAKQIAMTYYIK